MADPQGHDPVTPLSSKRNQTSLAARKVLRLRQRVTMRGGP